ncbi:MAG: T9SS type A sorting domain-containing protein [Bacteroidales bacterium]|nr:T9SS type A sorting domain-containing protein [Bacteroidales bacterium]
MKKIFLSCVVFLGLAAFTFADVIKQSYSFSQPKIESSDGFHRLQFEGLLQSGLAGEPTLPYQAVSLLIPPGHSASGIQIETGEEVYLEGFYRIFPMQYSQPISKGGSGIFAFKEDVYAKNAAYPEQMNGEVVTYFMNGFAVVMTSFTPVRYNPATGKLSYFKEITISIETKADETAAEALMNINSSEAVMQRLGLLVQNMEMVAAYPTRSGKSDDYDLLIITAAQFESTFQSMVSFYAPYGIAAHVVTTQTIYSSTPGQDNQAKIRNYIIQEYQDHGIQHVTLAGDVEHVPYRGFYCTVQSSSVYTDDDIPSDLYFSGLDGNWNTNGNNLWGEIGEDDLLPEIGIGRMSFSTATELSAMFNKLTSYMGSPILGELSNPLMAGEHLYDNPLTWGCDYLDLLVGYQNENGYITNGIPEDHNIEWLCDRDQTWSASLLRTKINQGKSFVHHVGHANSNYTMKMYNSDITNANFSGVNGTTHNYTLAYSHGCICGAFDDNDCIAERMINIENFAVAVIMNSRYGWFNEGQTEGPSAHLHREFVDALYTVKEPHIGMAHTLSRIKTAPWVNAPGQWEEGALRWCFYDCNVLGDAALRIWTDEPVNITATYQNALPIGVPSISINISGNGPVEGLVCSFIKDGITYGKALTNAAGQAQITFDQTITELGEAAIYVSGYNCLLNEFPVLVIPNEGAYVVYESSLINDAQGNNNGQPDYTESILLTTTLKNVGTAQASNVTATLLSTSQFVTITNANASFGTIPGQGTITVDDAFAFDIAGNVPDQHPIVFNIEAAGQKNWSSGFSIIANAPMLEKESVMINDAGTGNNNGMLDPGETANMVITIQNSGHAQAFSVEASLTSADQYITINTTSAQSLGNMNVGQSLPATFSVSASANTPAGYTAQLTFHIEAMHGIEVEQTISLLFTDYCYPTANCSFGDGLTGFSLGTISNMNSGCSSNGYGDFTSMSANIEQGQSYTVSLQTGYSDQNVCLWVDFNSNKEFESSELLLNDFNLANSGQVYTTQITIPQDVMGGLKRLRVRANWLDSASDPCANFSYGETEDYTVILPAGTLGVTAYCDPSEICLYESTQLMAIASGGSGNYTYQWSPVTGLSNPNIFNPVATPEETTTYTVEVNDGSSTISQQLVVTVHPLPATPVIQLNGAILSSSAASGNQWYCSLGMIEGATGQFYTCTWEDVYFVMVTGEYGCVSMQSNSIHVVVTAVDDPENQKDLSIYPNPFADKVFIEFESRMGENIKLSVYNALGQEVKVVSEGISLQNALETVEVSTEGFDNGIYYFKLTTDQRVVVKKMIRTR